METPPQQGYAPRGIPLGNFLSGMETSLYVASCSYVTTLETSLVEWKPQDRVILELARIASLETSLVEWKPEMGALSGGKSARLGNFLSGMETVQMQVRRVGLAVPWKLP